jgi:hypothetical protein
MKFLLIILLFSATIAFSFGAILKRKKDPVDQELDQVIKIVSSYAQKKYDLSRMGVGISSPNNVLLGMGISFQLNHQLSKEESQIILLDLARHLKDSINQSQILIGIMENAPFHMKNVTIDIFLRDENGDFTQHPQFSVISFSHGNFQYATNDPDSVRFKTHISEPCFEVE